MQLGVGAQVDDVGHPELVDEVLHVGRGQVLQVVGADQPPGCRVPAVAGRQAAEVTHVDEAVELDPPVRHRVIVGRARRGRMARCPDCPTATPRRRPASCRPRRSPPSGGSRLGIYVHVPFCAVRCGYCDFNTYTLTELGPGASTSTFVDSALVELDVAARVLGAGAGPVDTVFVGGGTPTLLPAADLVRCVDGIRERFGLAPDAEVTTEANPDSVTAADLEVLRRAGSPGCRSGCSRSCRTCWRPWSARTTRRGWRRPWRARRRPGWRRAST